MDGRRRMVAAACVVAAIGLGASEARARQEDDRGREGPAERLGQQLDRVLRDVEDRFRDLSADVRARFAEAKARVEDLGLEARVYGRLRWDKALSMAEIAVEVREGDVVVLHGSVAGAEARRKAVRLAVDTVGVERVVDQLRAVAPEEAEDDRRPEG